MTARYQCPACKIQLTLTTPPDPRVECPKCGQWVTLAPVGGAPPAAPQPASRPVPQPAPRPAPAQPKPMPLPADDEPDLPSARPAAKPWAKIGAGVGVAALVAVGIAFALRGTDKPVEQAKADPPPTQPAPPVVVPPVVVPPVTPPQPKVEQPPPKKEQVPPKKEQVPPKPQYGPPELSSVQLELAPPRRLKLGVNGSGYDNVGAILTSLGKGYAYEAVVPADLESEERLLKFDVVFLNCGGPVGVPERTAPALREFVGRGRTLYASDLQYDLVARAFPGSAVPAKVPSGTNTGNQRAEVLDPGLQEQLGKTVDLAFNAGGWKTASFEGGRVTTILKAANTGLVPKDTPLLVRVQQGEGRMFYTSFHNSAIASDTAKKLLRYLVFSAVVADAEARVVKAFRRDRFSPRSTDLFSADDAGWSGSKKYTLELEKDERAKFRVGLAFNSEDAEIHLRIEGPDGVKFEKSGKDAFIVEVKNAAAGEWRFTVTAKGVPYPNFPLALIASEDKPQ